MVDTNNGNNKPLPTFKKNAEPFKQPDPLGRVITPKFDKNGFALYDSITSPSDDTYAIAYVVPDRVIPVIFVPGVMGSNLCVKNENNDASQKPVWLLDSLEGMAYDWIKADAKARKKLLRPEITDVYRKGAIPEGSLQTKEELLRRGWGEVGYTSYGDALLWLENTLNESHSPLQGQRANLIGQALEGAIKMEAVTRDEVALSYKYRLPVHAVGYNWLDSNAQSAERLKAKINEYIAFYAKNFKCEQVIVVTHSMGGLVARYCSENLGMSNKILGIVHGVMPAIGAAAVYRRMKAGTENPKAGSFSLGNLAGGAASHVLGGDAAEMTAVLSSAPGPLQLLPSKEYGMGWLQFHDGKKEVPQFRLPKADPYSEIYTVRGKWWGLCDDRLIDPRDTKKERLEEDWKSFAKLIPEKVQDFHEKIKDKYHANTYAFIGVDDAHRAYGKVQWTLTHSNHLDNQGGLPDNLLDAPFNRLGGVGTESPLREPKKGTAGFDYRPAMFMEISRADEAGDGTVPHKSGAAVKDHAKGYFELKRIDHEGAYKSPNAHARAATLLGILKIVQRIKAIPGMVYK